MKYSLSIRFSDIIIICLGLAFFQGLASFIGIPSMPYQFVFDCIVFFFFLTMLIAKKDRLVAPAFNLFFIFTFIVVLSGVFNQSEFYTAYRMYRNALIPFLFFISVINTPLSEESFRRINNFIFIMLFVQILAAVMKFVALGVREGVIIGTFETQAGTMSTLFPLLAIIFLFLLYLFHGKKNIYIFLMLGFLFFAWGGGKRAIVFLLPPFLVFTYLIYLKYEWNVSLVSIKNIYRAIIVITLFIPFFYLLVIFTPTLNPDREFGGTFDINHLIDYATDYQFSDHYIYNNPIFGGQTVLHGRQATLRHSLQLTTTNTETFFLGYGPSSIYATQRGDEVLVSFGVTAFQTGFSQYIMLVGIPAALILLLYYLQTAIYCLRAYNSINVYWRPLVLGVFISAFVLLYDYFFYSASFMRGLIPSMLYFYLAGAIINKYRVSKEEHVLPSIDRSS